MGCIQKGHARLNAIQHAITLCSMVAAPSRCKCRPQRLPSGLPRNQRRRGMAVGLCSGRLHLKRPPINRAVHDAVYRAYLKNAKKDRV